MPAIPVITNIPAVPQRLVQKDPSFSFDMDAVLRTMHDDTIPEMNAAFVQLVAALAAANYSATSTSPVAIGTGAKSFTIQDGKLHNAATLVMIVSAANPANWMYGRVSSYNFANGAMVVDVTRVGGAGTFSDWVIALSGPQGIGGDVLPAFAGNFGKSFTVNSGENAGEWTFPDLYCYLSAHYTLTSTTAVQKLFNSTANGALTLPTGRYFFEMMAFIDTMSATSGNATLYLKGAGTATLANALATLTAYDGWTAGGGLAFTGSYKELASGDLPMSGPAPATNGDLFARVSGFFSVSGAGTIIPSVALDTAAAARVRAGASFMCRRIGSTATTNGSWS